MIKPFTLIIALVLAVTGVYADPAFTTKEVPVNYGRLDGGTIPLR